MGYAARQNLQSKWNKRRVSRTELPDSTQTTQKENFVQVMTPHKDEPVVVELTLKNIWGTLCRRLIPKKKLPQSQEPTS